MSVGAKPGIYKHFGIVTSFAEDLEKQTTVFVVEPRKEKG
jgi:hypothetical protein